MWVRGRKVVLPNDKSLVSSLQSQIEDLQNKLNAKVPDVSPPTDTTGLEKKIKELEQQNQRLNQHLNAGTNDRAAIMAERDSLKDQLKTAAKNNDNLQAQIAAMQQLIKSQQVEINDWRTVTISGYRIFYWDGNWNLSQSHYRQQNDSDFDSKTLHYILCEFSGPNPLPGKQFFSTALDVRYIGPDHQLRNRMVIGGMAPAGTAEWNGYSGWGSDHPGSFTKGEWTVEVWYQDRKLGQLHFRVH
jgi:regulator of replication initiation timing